MPDARRFSFGQRYSHTLYDGERRWAYLWLYDDAESMIRAANRYSRRYGDPDWHHPDNMTGCFQDKPRRQSYNRKTKQWVTLGSKTFAGNIRMVDSVWNAEILVHEIAHMAFAIYRDDVVSDFMADFGDHNDDKKEEILCYLLGDLANSAAFALESFLQRST